MCHNVHMRKATVRDLHLRTGAIVDQATEGQVITIVKRGVPVAELRPISAQKRSKVFGQEHWERLAKFPKVPDSGRWLEKNR